MRRVGRPPISRGLFRPEKTRGQDRTLHHPKTILPYSDEGTAARWGHVDPLPHSVNKKAWLAGESGASSNLLSQ